SLDEEMSSLLYQLLAIKKVAIITGGGFPQLKKQVIDKIIFDSNRFKNLYLFPTKGAMMYNFDGENWQKIYEKLLTKENKKKIIDAFDKVYKEVDFLPKEHYGDFLEDRDSQFTFSALGQDAPVELKKVWDKDISKRKELKKHLDKYLPEFAVEIGGSTSIDITQKLINKAFAIEKICEILNIKGEEILFIGDAIFKEGNDYSVIKTAVENINVDDYNETKEIIKKIINCE
ncbi:MAG: HAD family hydrolase, partial [Flavobacterium sp.]|nr:HAD family hydrolase [Flavobacterium sp.]